MLFGLVVVVALGLVLVLAVLGPRGRPMAPERVAELEAQNWPARRLSMVLELADHLAARGVLARDWAAATRKPGRVSFRRLERILRSREAKPGLRNVEADSLFDAAMVLDRDGHELLHELKARWIVAR